MMFANILIFALFVSISQAGYAGSYGGNYVGAGGAGGYGYGYGGAFPVYPQQFFAPPIPYDFGSLMAGLNQLQARLQHAPLGGAGGYAYSGSYPGPYVGMPSSYPVAPRTYTPLPPPITSPHQSVVGGGYTPSFESSGYSGGYGGGYGGSYGGGYGGSYGSSFSKTPIPLSLGAYNGYSAGASASLGGNEVKQAAYLNPANPASPNVNVRFSGGSIPGGTSKSVYVSSSSASGNINGTPYHQRHASTTVNDNGKVSSYTVHDRK